MTNVMMGYIEREVTSSVALLDHLPPDERAEWLPRLARRTYHFILGPGRDRSAAGCEAVGEGGAIDRRTALASGIR